MTAGNKHYRGTTAYARVFAELRLAAEYRGVTTYQDLAAIMGLPQRGAYMGAETGHILGAISEDEVNAGRPMLSAVAVSIKGMPGPGFFDWARTLGRLPAGADERAFWEKERDAVYEAWKRPLPRAQ